MYCASFSDKTIVEALDGLPEHKLHCSVLGATALKNAIAHYHKTRAGKQRQASGKETA